VLISNYPELLKQREALLQATNRVAKTLVINSSTPFSNRWLSR